MKNNRGGGVGLEELGGAYRFNSILLGKILQIISVILRIMFVTST